MLDALRPGDIAHVHQPVDALFHLDKSAEIGEAANASRDRGPDGVFITEREPGIWHGLLESQGNAALLLADPEHQHFQFISDGHDLRRVLHSLRPGHFAYVHKSLDPGLQLHKSAVIGDPYYLAVNAKARRIALRHGSPRIGNQLLAPQRDAHLLAIELQNFQFQLVAYLEHFGWILHAAPGNVRDV